MSNIKLNCCICGKELGLGNRVSSDGVLWRCEDCARKQREEYDNKGKTIADLEAKLADKDEKIKKLKSENHALMSDNAYQEADIFELNSFKEYYKNNKILFCIEKLKEVKKLFEEKYTYDVEESDFAVIYEDDVEEIIDNQIKQLKEQKL